MLNEQELLNMSLYLDIFGWEPIDGFTIENYLFLFALAVKTKLNGFNEIECIYEYFKSKDPELMIKGQHFIEKKLSEMEDKIISQKDLNEKFKILNQVKIFYKY
jgi:hypothetical protein